MRIKRCENLRFHDLNGESMLYDADVKLVHVLNESAQFIWAACNDTVTIEEVSKQVSQNYDIDEQQATEDVRQTIESFLEKNIVELVEP